MAVNALDADIRADGMGQGDLVILLQNLVDTVNELVDDHATSKTAVDAIETLIEELHDDHATVKTFIDECKVDIDAAKADLDALHAAIVGITAKLDADAGVTDTNYASTHDPAAITATTIAATAVATLTATKPASGPAALSDSTDLTLNA